MENLSDEEFGVSKSAEEAPILVAQRYLNIFRQVHIFNKAKRNQFDDELLALPDNIIAFIKRMPGGRLLIEHIEDVKTERGISFVKANRDEFSNGDDSSPATPAMVPMQGVGGSVVMDSSFAETLAKSLASAFKNAPVSAAGGANFSAPADIGQAFGLIAEEIRSSHSSLLDVLKETRNITDSVIASQVSISRILESILSSHSPEGGNNDEVNNRIVASQASITKLLENLYNSNAKNDEKLDKYLDIESRLSRFENDIRNNVNSSLNEIRALVTNNTYKPVVSSMQNYESKPDVTPSQPRENAPVISSNNEGNKKKKNKNKNKNKEQFASYAAPLAASATIQDTVLDNLATDNTTSTPQINAVIRNSAYKHEDDFSNVDLNEPPLEFGVNEDVPAQTVEEPAITMESSVEEPADILSDLGDLDDFDLSSAADTKEETPIEDKLSDSVADFDGDFNLDNLVNADEDITSENTVQEPIVQPTETEDILNNVAEPTSLDDFEAVKDLDISLPDDSELDSHFEAQDEAPSLDDVSDLDSFTQNDTEIGDVNPAQDIDELDSHFEAQEETPVLDDVSDLDSFTQNNTEIEDENPVQDDDVQLPEELNNEELSLDDFNTNKSPAEENYEEQNEEDFVPEEDTEDKAHYASPYNDTLDKIREALTSDSVDIASLDEPIALDDYSDDENVGHEDLTPAPRASDGSAQESADDSEWEYEYVEDDGSDSDENSDNTSSENSDEDWEYEYVDENGNVVTSKEGNQDGEDWEWEYVDEDGNATSDDENNPQ